MIAGLPWGTWLLILAACVPGLAMGFAAFRAHGRPSREPPAPDGDERPGPPDGSGDLRR